MLEVAILLYYHLEPLIIHRPTTVVSN